MHVYLSVDPETEPSGWLSFQHKVHWKHSWLALESLQPGKGHCWREGNEHLHRAPNTGRDPQGPVNPTPSSTLHHPDPMAVYYCSMSPTKPWWHSLSQMHSLHVAFMLLKNKPEGSGSSISSPSTPLGSTQSFGHMHWFGFKVCFPALIHTPNSIINTRNAKQTSHLHSVSHVLLGSTCRRCTFITVPRIQWPQSDTKCFFISHWTIDAPEFPNNKYQSRIIYDSTQHDRN